MNERQQFWLQKDRWPRDAVDHVFLARAVHLVGKAMFPEWTGKEPVVLDRCALTQVDPDTGVIRGVSQSDALGWQVRRIRKLLQLPDQKYKNSSLTDRQWMQGLKLAAAVDGKDDPARQRFKRVKAALIAGIESGRIQSTIWKRGSAHMELVSASLWSVEDVDNRFFWCLMNPDDPFGLGIGGDNFYSIFVTRVTLDQFMSELAERVQKDALSVKDNPTAKKYPQAHLQRWFEGQVSNWKEAGADVALRPTREEIVEKAQSDNPGVSAQRMRDLWADLAPQEWRGKGPRQKRE